MISDLIVFTWETPQTLSCILKLFTAVVLLPWCNKEAGFRLLGGGGGGEAGEQEVYGGILYDELQGIKNCVRTLATAVM